MLPPSDAGPELLHPAIVPDDEQRLIGLAQQVEELTILGPCVDLAPVCHQPDMSAPARGRLGQQGAEAGQQWALLPVAGLHEQPLDAVLELVLDHMDRAARVAVRAR